MSASAAGWSSSRRLKAGGDLLGLCLFLGLLGWLAASRRTLRKCHDRALWPAAEQQGRRGRQQRWLPLQYFVARGVPVLGVEPAANVAAVAREKCVPSEVAFIGKTTAERLLAEGHAADLMAANNVLAHVPDILDFVAGFRCC